jgi:ribose/xylose/arabinose/galactoside ABC-type transport system permease subunit
MDKNTALSKSNMTSSVFLRRSANILGENIMIIFIIILAIALSFLNKNFMTVQNMLNVLRQLSYVGIIAIGMTFVILSAQIDLSVGSVAALAGMMFGVLFRDFGAPWPLALAGAIFAGIVVGLINGTFVAYLRIPAFVVTLGMMTILRGAVLLMSQGRSIGPYPDKFVWIGTGFVFGLPFPTILLIIMLIVGFIALKYSIFGRYVYAIGGNPEAARLSGVNVKKFSLIVFLIVSFAAALAGIVMTARLNSSVPSLGDGMEMDAIAAVCVGGTSLYGGRGSILKTIVGALIMTLIRNGLNILRVSTWWQLVVVGLILIVAVYSSTRREK